MKRRGKLLKIFKVCLSFFGNLRFRTTLTLHQKATKFKWYKKWHDFKLSHAIHVLVFVIYAVGVLGGSFGLFNGPGKAYAATNTWTQTSDAQFNQGSYSSTALAGAGDTSVQLGTGSFSNNGGGTWSYKQPVTIDNSSNANALSNYQAQVNSELPGTIADYHFDEGNGTTTVYDSSPSAINGTASATTVWDTSTKKYGNAAFTSAGSSYVDVNGLPVNTTAGAKNTVDFWMNASAINSTLAFGFNVYDLIIYTTTSCFGFNTGNGDCYGIPNATVTGSWVHITAVFNNGDYTQNQIYVNGALQTLTQRMGSQNTPAAVAQGNVRIAGFRTATGSNLSGKLDEFRIYNRALTQAEVTQRYNDSSSSFFSHVKADGSDVRFAETGPSNELPFWQEKFSNTNNIKNYKYWVKENASQIPGSSTKTINMYYGNASATAVSNGGNTFSFYDDFESGNLNNWTGTTNWAAATDQKYSGSYSAKSQATNATLSKTLTSMSSGIYEGWFRFAATADQYPMFLTDNRGHSAYWFEARATGHFQYYDGSGYYNFPVDTTYSGSTWYKVKVAFDYGQSKYWVYVNDNPITPSGLSAKSDDGVISSSLVSWTTSSGNSTTWLDEARIRQYTTVEPTCSVGAEAAAGITGYVSSGTYTSSLIQPTGLYGTNGGTWGTLTANATLNSQSIKIQVLKPDGTLVPDTDLANNSTGFGNTSFPVSQTLSTLSPTTYPAIKLMATLVGNGSQTPLLDAWSVVNYTYDLTPPAAPTGLTVTSTSSANTLNWSEPTVGGQVGDSESGVYGYLVQRAADSEGSPGTWGAPGAGCLGVGTKGTLTGIITSGTSCTDSGLTSNTKYYYRVQAVDNALNGSALGTEMTSDANTKGLWHFNEGSGTSAADSSGNNDTATMNGSSYWNSSGKYNSSFNGTGSTYATLATALPMTAAFSAEAWINQPSFGGSVQAIVGDSNVGGSIYWVFYVNGQKLRFVTYSNGTDYRYFETTNNVITNTNNWYHVAATQTGTADVVFYVNGQPVTSSLTSSLGSFVKPAAQGTAIGRTGQYAGQYFVGQIDELRISNKVRTASEISNYYSYASPNYSGWSGESNVDTNVKGLWHLNEGTGGVTQDASGNGNNGSFTGTGYWTSGNGGRFGEAGNFSGDDSINAGSATSLNVSTAVSIGAWVKTSQATSGMIIQKYNTSAPYQGYGLKINNSGPNKLDMWVGSATWSEVSYNWDGNWHYVVGTYDGSNVKLYVDGNVIGSPIPQSGSLSYATAPLYIGSYTGSSNYFIGQMDEVRISNTALSAPTILANFNESNPQPKSATTLVATPTLTAPTTPQNTTKPTISGTGATPSTTVRLYDNGTLKASKTADSSGNFTFSTSDYSATLTEGAHTNITARGYNGSAETVDSNAVSETVDTVSPTTAISSSPADADGTSGWFKTNPTITLTAADPSPSGGGGTTYYKWDDVTFATPFTYSAPLNMNTSIGQGTHTLYWRTVDTANNQEQIQSQQFKLDSVASVSTLTTNPAAANGNAGYFKTNPTITLAATDVTSGLLKIQYKWGDNDFSSGTTDYSTGFNVPTDTSSNTLYYRAIDNAGNIEATKSQLFKLDTVKPFSTLTTNPTPNNGDNGYFKSNPMITLAPGDATSGPSTVRFQWSDSPLVSLTSTTTYSSPFDMNSTVGQGTHTLYWQTTDVAGNLEDIQSQQFKLDSVSPFTDSNTSLVIGDDSGFVNASTTGHVDLHVLATDLTSGLDKVVISMDGILFDKNSTSCTFSYNTLIPNWDLNTAVCGTSLGGDGSKTVYVKFTDNAGNDSAIVSKTIIYDGTNPNNTTTVTGHSLPSQDTPDIFTSLWAKYANPQFRWDGASDDTAGVKDYWVYFGTDQNAEPKDSNTTNNLFYVDNENSNLTTAKSYIVTSVLTSGQTYYLKVRSRDNALNNANTTYVEGNNEFIYKFDNTPPNNITYVRTTPAGYSSTDIFTFEWDQITDSFSTLDKYVYRKADGIDGWHNLTAVPDPVTGKITLSGITHYKEDVNKVQIKAIDKAGNESSIAEGVYYYAGNIPAPKNITVDLSHSANQTVNSYAFSWEKPDGVTPQGYYYSVNALPDAQNSTFVPYTGSTTTIGFAAFATRIGPNNFYVVTKASDTVGWTNYNNPPLTFTCNTAGPGIPQNVMISDSSNRDSQRWQLTVNWDEPAQVNPDFNGYIVERGTDGTNFAQIATTAIQTTGYLDTNLLNNVTYYYRILAKDNTGNKSATSTVVSKQPTGKYTTPPNIIGNTKINVQATKASVSWTTDRNADSFVQVGTSDKYGMTQGQLDDTSTHEVNLSGLTPGAFYHYRSMWRDTDGNIGYSKDATFKTQDAPGISEVTVSDIRLTSAIISWKSTTISTSNVLYGKTNSYGTTLEDQSGSTVTTHVVKLDNLADSSTYHFKITGQDVDGNPLSSDDYSFETLTFPRLSNIKVTQQMNSATSTIKVTWDSNVPTSSVVQYLEGNGNTPHEVSKSLLETKHTLLVSGLKDSTSYKLTVLGRDSYGNEATSDRIAYSTPFDTRPPEIMNVTTEISTVGFGADAKGQAVISWETDEVSTSQVEYDVGATIDDTFPLMSKEDGALTTSHIVIVTDLKPSSAFHFRVVSKDGSNNVARSDGDVFLTEQASSSVLDVIIKSLQNSIGWLFGMRK